MRVFQQLGVVDAIEPHVEPFTPSEYFGVDGQLIRRMTMVAPPLSAGLHAVDGVHAAARWSACCARAWRSCPTSTVALGRRDDVARAGRRRRHAAPARCARRRAARVRARYVIACDGGSSTVRAQLGIELEDLDFDEPWLVVDVLVNERGLAKLPKTSVQYCEPRAAVHAGDRPEQPPALGDLAASPAKTRSRRPRPRAPGSCWRAGSRRDDGELWRQASYRFHALVARHWRAGRVFLAGDAAHMQPPFLGQGMCQGVRDVANLAWKLAAVLARRGAGAAARSAARQLRRRAQGACARAHQPHQGRGRGDLRARRGQGARARCEACSPSAAASSRTRRARTSCRALEAGLLSARASAARGTLVSAAVAASAATRRSAWTRARAMAGAWCCDDALAHAAPAGPASRRCTLGARRRERPKAWWRPGCAATNAMPRWCGPTTTCSASRRHKPSSTICSKNAAPGCTARPTFNARRPAQR